MRNLYCLASELAFLVICSKVSFMIMHVKPKRAWSALGWVTATRYMYNSLFCCFLNLHQFFLYSSTKTIRWTQLKGFISSKFLFVLAAQEELGGHIWWLHQETDGRLVGRSESDVCQHSPDPWPHSRWPLRRGVYYGDISSVNDNFLNQHF